MSEDKSKRDSTFSITSDGSDMDSEKTKLKFDKAILNKLEKNGIIKFL